MPGEFVLDVAADLYGVKENLSVRFASRPTVMQLKAKTEALFQTEANVQRPPGAMLQHVRIRKFQYFNDYDNAWRPLATCDQLVHNGQVYAFQEESDDYQGAIPVSSPPRSRISVPAASPARHRGGAAVTGHTALHELKHIVNTSPHRDRLQNTVETTNAPMIPGESLLAEVRETEAQKAAMDIDAHRHAVRRETMNFLSTRR